MERKIIAHKRKSRLKKWDVTITYSIDGYRGYTHTYNTHFNVKALTKTSAENKAFREFSKGRAYVSIDSIKSTQES
jgi:hypothetical protein